LSQEINNYWAQAFSAFALSIALQSFADYEAALEVAARGLEASRNISFRALSVMNQINAGMAYFSLGMFNEAQKALTEASRLNLAQPRAELINRMLCGLYLEKVI
jgi:tetratricopeptide (TPR) repeat protein